LSGVGLGVRLKLGLYCVIRGDALVIGLQSVLDFGGLGGVVIFILFIMFFVVNSIVRSNLIIMFLFFMDFFLLLFFR
ncbi:hypothetical protein ACTHT3_20760, partial [Neisseria sp. P0015.S004]